MDFRRHFSGKVIIVTGASSGIGLAAAKLFGAAGARVVMASRSLEKMQALSREVSPSPENVLCVRCDVSIEADCRRLIEETVARFGRIDILVNNAGVSMRATIRDLDLSVLRRLMDVNYWGTVYCTKYALPYLLESRGQVVGVVSVAGYAALPARSGYSASKHAVRGFLDALRMEHLRDGLGVLVFAPGYTASNVRNAALLADGTPQGETPLDEGRLMSAEKCASYLAFALARRRSEMILTPLGKATVAFHHVLPRLTDRLTCRFIAREKDSPVK
jgi:NAD(P)-dependent dehydrogenase (short-subunit alcohol dehydrogenase family)